MSGGRWDYLSRRFDEAQEFPVLVGASLRLLGAIEHELDWGYSGDTCPRCARRRVLDALNAFYDQGGLDVYPALSILKDHEALHNVCYRHLEDMPNWYPAPNALVLANVSAELRRRLDEGDAFA